MDIFWGLFKTVRPRQWVKNLALFAPIVFSGLLFTDNYFWVVCEAILVFVILSSGVYLFNDLLDIQSDKLHPYKKKRPLASGQLPVAVAVFSMITCFVVAIAWSLQISYFFFLTSIVYLAMQFFYTLWFKKVAILDVLTIASGYIMRVYAGGFAINAHMDVWFLLTVVSASLFLAVGKRRCEMTLLKASGGAGAVRATLKHYTEPLLDLYTGMFATTTWLTYAMFTFNHPRIIPKGAVLTIMADLPRTLVSEKLLMVTTPLVIYGVMRYLLLIYERNEGESPERVLLTDKALITTMIVWGLMTVGLIYYVGA